MLARIHLVGLVVAFATRRPAHADDHPTPVALDEATFLQRLRARAPRTATFDARRVAAHARVASAGVVPNPTLAYEREAVPSLDASDDFVRFGWALDLAGRRGLASAAAHAGARAESLDADRDAHVFEVDARLAYLDAVYARERARRLDAARASLHQMVEALRSRAKQGDASSYDAERAALELDLLDDERATVLRTLETARLRLGGMLGEPAQRYDASDALSVPAKPVTAIARQRVDVDAALARASQSERELAGARRTWIPRFELNAGLKMSHSSSGDGVGYVVGIGGDIPVFDRGGAAADRARADAKRWRVEAAALANDARAESEQARRELVLRIEQAETYLAGPAARAGDLERRATVAYREGDRPILELLDVHRAARLAALRATELIYEARRAELLLHRAQGGVR